MDRPARFALLSAVVCAVMAPASDLSELSAQPATAPVIAVAAFNVHVAPKDSRDFAGVGTAVAALLATDLGSRAKVRVLDRAQVQRTVGLQPLDGSGMVNRDAVVSAAKLLGAQHVIYGGFTADASDNVRLDARGVNVSTGTVEFSERIQGRGDDIMSLVHQLSSSLIAGMSLPAATGAASGTTSALPLRSLGTYGKALDAVDRGDRAHAQALLATVLRDHPDFAPAKSAMGGLKP